jgi:arylsulfatase A-like enzyme
MWLKRHWQIALACGAGLGGLGQIAVFALARSEIDTSLTQQAAALLYSIGFIVCLGLGLGLATARLLRRPGGRIAAIALSTTILSLLALTLTVGVACRLVSGSYLTAGAVMFTLNSSEHFLHAATSGYLRIALLGLGVLSAFVFVCVRLLRPAAVPLESTPRRELMIGAVLLVLLAIPYWRRSDHRFTRGVFVSAPLLALVSSLEPDFELDRSNARPDAIAEPLAPPGPLRGEERAWQATIASHAGAKPNVLLIMLESLAPRHLGFMGYSRPTPEIDRLLREGLFMRRAWTTATHSNYAQPAILASLFPRRGHGLDHYQRLDYPRFLFHDVFHALGYDTATVSSQDEDWQGMKRFQSTGTPTFFWYADDYQGDGLDSGVERVAPDEATTDVALEWLTKRQKPWAMYVNFQATHFPYTLAPGTPRPYRPDEPTWSTFTYLGYPASDRAAVINRYDNALAHVDRQIGRLRRHLEETGQLDNTLVVVTADHGELFFDRGMVTHGRTLYDIESRVPIALRWPGKVPVEQRDEPVSHLDIMPTVLAALGLPPHPSWQGQSFLSPRPELVGKRALFLNIQGLRFADAIICWPYKLNIDRTGKQPHLYDLAADPDEQRDLIEAQPLIAEELNRVLNNQLIAQLDYHRKDALPVRSERFAPRLRGCPDLASRRR